MIHGNNGKEVEAQISAADLCKLINPTEGADDEAQLLFSGFNPNGSEIFAADLCIDQWEPCTSTDIEAKAIIEEDEAESPRAMTGDGEQMIANGDQAILDSSGAAMEFPL